MKDTKGYTPIFLACWRGYKTRQDNSDEEKERIKQRRYTCVYLLLDEGADYNFQT